MDTFEEWKSSILSTLGIENPHTSMSFPTLMMRFALTIIGYLAVILLLIAVTVATFGLFYFLFQMFPSFCSKIYKLAKIWMLRRERMSDLTRQHFTTDKLYPTNKLDKFICKFRSFCDFFRFFVWSLCARDQYLTTVEDLNTNLETLKLQLHTLPQKHKEQQKNEFAQLDENLLQLPTSLISLVQQYSSIPSILDLCVDDLEHFFLFSGLVEYKLMRRGDYQYVNVFRRVSSTSSISHNVYDKLNYSNESNNLTPVLMMAPTVVFHYNYSTGLRGNYCFLTESWKQTLLETGSRSRLEVDQLTKNIHFLLHFDSFLHPSSMPTELASPQTFLTAELDKIHKRANANDPTISAMSAGLKSTLARRNNILMLEYVKMVQFGVPIGVDLVPHLVDVHNFINLTDSSAAKNSKSLSTSPEQNANVDDDELSTPQ